MSKRSGWLIFLTAIIVLPLVGFWLYANRTLPTTEAPGVPKVPPAVARAGTGRPILERVQSRTPKSQISPHKKLSNGEPPGQVVMRVAASSDANTPDGDYAIATALERCAHVLGSDAEIEERQIAKSLEVDTLRQKVGAAIPDKASVDETAKAIAEIKQERDSCASVPKNQVDSWRARLEVMAQAGDMQARQRLIDSIQPDFSSQKEIDANPDEYEHRMALAKDYLLDRIADGDCSQAILTNLADLGFGAETSYVFWRIFAERTLRTLPNPGLTPEANDQAIAHLKNKLNELQTQVPSETLDDANQTVAYLQQVNCAQ